MTLTDKELEIYQALRELQNKHTYFLFAVVGAAMALVVKQTHGESLSWSQIPLAAALFAWALSFFLAAEVEIMRVQDYARMQLF